MPDSDLNSTSATHSVDDARTLAPPPRFDGGPGTSDGAGRNGRASQPSLAGSIARHPFLALLPAIFLLAAGIVVGAKKHPSYSASATINVGKSDIITQATPGYVQAAQVLASSYSRVVMSDHVSVPVAQALERPVGFVSSHLVAAPIPGEPTFNITATAAARQDAVNLANAAVNAIVKFANTSQTQQGSPSQLLSQYTKAQGTADRLHSKAGSLQAKLRLGLSGVSQAQVNKVQLAAQIAGLQAQAFGNAYTTLLQNGVAPVLDVFSQATSTTSNRTSNIEKYAVIGAVAGLVLGLALAALVGGLENRRASHRAY
jgi:capsular polysaccharide biosynthesis protein